MPATGEAPTAEAMNFSSETPSARPLKSHEVSSASSNVPKSRPSAVLITRESMSARPSSTVSLPFNCVPFMPPAVTLPMRTPPLKSKCRIQASISAPGRVSRLISPIISSPSSTGVCAALRTVPLKEMGAPAKLPERPTSPSLPARSALIKPETEALKSVGRFGSPVMLTRAVRLSRSAVPLTRSARTELEASKVFTRPSRSSVRATRISGLSRTPGRRRKSTAPR